MANEQLIARGYRVMFRSTALGIGCLVMTVPGILLWQNGLAWHMGGWLTYGPLGTAAMMLVCSGISFFNAYRINCSIKQAKRGLNHRGARLT